MLFAKWMHDINCIINSFFVDQNKSGLKIPVHAVAG